MITVNQLALSFGGFELFKEISFQLNEGERVGLVGRNGAGKTTLLKVIAGEMQPTSGSVSVPNSISIGYLPQQMALPSGRSVMDEALMAFSETLELSRNIDRIGKELSERNDYESAAYLQLIDRLAELTDRFNLLDGETANAKTEQTLLGLGFRRSDFSRGTNEFSGGWRMRVELAKILLRKPQVLLLDEPTNHLDIESIQWLEDYLKDYPGSLLLISHDRAFLDNVTQRTIELSLGKLYDYKVPYSQYVELHRQRREQQIAAYRNQQKVIEDTNDFIERFRYKATKSVQVQSRIKMLERMEIIEVDEDDTASVNIRFPSAPRSGDVVCEAKDVAKSFGPKKIFEGVNFTIERGQKVAFVGRNGEGKTTMSRIITGELSHEGSLKIGHNVTIGYFAQNQDELLDGSLTVLETIDRVAVGDIRTRMRDILGAFLFRGDDVDKKVGVLSGGERNRLALAKLMLQPYNLLVLDEPTNHLDMHSKEVLKSALMQYDGTAILVSHDRDFLDGIVGKVYEFSDGAVREHIGGIYDFLRRKKMESLKQLEQKAQADVQATGSRNESDQKRLWAERKELDREIRNLENSLKQVESRISTLENEVDEVNHRLADPNSNINNLSDSDFFTGYENKKRQLLDYMQRWEELSLKLEELKLKRNTF